MGRKDSKCNWCEREPTERLIARCSDGTLVTSFWCKPHMLQFVEQQKQKGHTDGQLRHVDTSSDSGGPVT